MIERTDDELKTVAAMPDAAEELSYRIELWQEREPPTVERVLARAFSASLAQAIYKAAQTEHPDRRITLSQRDRLIADSTTGEALR